VSDLIPSDRLWELDELYRGRFEVEDLSYGTVRDLADSMDNLGGLARASSDMKDLQRCWMVKALLGKVERGGRLVEIGAGEPLVAGVLTRLGYEVTVVDPYDGSGQGPQQYDEFRRAYPDVDFIRERFPPGQGLPGGTAGIYSISVLEHIPTDAVGEVVAAATDALVPGGHAIHAIDHVLAGWGADAHRERLEVIVRSSGLSLERLHELVRRLEVDPEAYFVSAEAHERWRGALPYEDYPMRRIASIGVLSRR
jgi:SAM-dependent methyltransferase